MAGQDVRLARPVDVLHRDTGQRRVGGRGVLLCQVQILLGDVDDVAVGRAVVGSEQVFGRHGRQLSFSPVVGVVVHVV